MQEATRNGFSARRNLPALNVRMLLQASSEPSSQGAKSRDQSNHPSPASDLN